MEQSSSCPRLIEVALPIREISAESVRDKNLHHAHIRNLHVWWARRPLAASRAIVFASLVPDPDDARCPEAFKKAVERCLRTQIPAELSHYGRGRETVRDEDPYRPYHGLDDTLRNRLLMFIARWSREYLDFEEGRSAEPPGPSLLLDDRSLAKWETSDPDNAQGHAVLRVARELIHVCHDGRVPVVLDPFAGGGAIPLETGRLGGQSLAIDYNPVAYLILRATCEYPQKYGTPGKRNVAQEEFGRRVERVIEVANTLIHDFEACAKRILDRTRERVGYLYPPGKDGRPVVAYLWARTVPCSNPSCRAEIPLLRSLVLCSKDAKIALTVDVDKRRKEIRFGIAKDRDITATQGTKAQRGPAKCPFCGEPTSEGDLRRAAIERKMKERMVAVVVQGRSEKDYRPVEDADLRAVEASRALHVDPPSEYIVPEINGPGASPDAGAHRSINLELYGLTRWGQLFNHRQLVVLNELVQAVHDELNALTRVVAADDYRRALGVYLGLWIDRIAAFGNSMCLWASGSEIVKTPFGRQSVAMLWDYAEANPFSESSGSADTQLEYMLQVLRHERAPSVGATVHLESATKLENVGSESCDVVVTDPPYGNSIAYADLSDFFYVWLKRTIGKEFPALFATPQTPKELEATSHKHRHGGSQERANDFYRRLLTESFKESKRGVKPPKIVAVMFAHQSTEAWTALLSALFDAGLCPNATWPIDTELTSALKRELAALSSSVTVVCRPRVVGAAVAFREVKKEIEEVVRESVQRFWSYGFRGADLIVACYGPAVGVFGKYERVEKADGTPVGIPELLVLARQAARDAIAGEFRGDNLSTLYYVWANLYGAAEQAWDDARLVVQIGGDADNAMEVARGHGIFVVDGSKCRLALLGDRADRRGLGIDQNPPFIDALHRSMLFWKEEKREELVGYLTERNLLEDGPFWKLGQALFEVLPRDLEDWKLVSTLLGERQTLRTEGRRAAFRDAQQGLSFDEGGERRS